MPEVDLSPAVPIFIRRQHAESTKVAYERELRRFLAWLADHPLDPEVLPSYMGALRARNLSPTTIAWRGVVVASFLRDAHRQGVISEDLTVGYRLPRGTRGFAPRVLSAAELKRLLATPDRRSWQGKRDAAVLACLGIGGLRAGEVVRLSIGDVDVRSDRAVLRVLGKGDKRRAVVLRGAGASAIRVWTKMRAEADSRAPFFLARADRPMRVSTVDYIVRKNSRAAGLNGVHAHLLRHTAASRAIGSGVPLHHVRDMLGHSSIATTSKYLHVTA